MPFLGTCMKCVKSMAWGCLFSKVDSNHAQHMQYKFAANIHRIEPTTT